MRLIKLAIISIIVLFIVITGISLFIPSHIRISRAIDIEAPKDSVMALIKDAGRWKSWYPGADTLSPFYIGGIKSGYITDTSNPQKPSFINITDIKSDEVIAMFSGKKLRPIVNGWKLIPTPHADSVTLQWYMDFHLRWYPWEKFSSLAFEKMYGAGMEAALSRLKRTVEK